MIIGIFLVMIGILWVLSNTGVITANISQFFWPVVFIAVGIQILWDHSKRDRNCCKPKE